MDLKLGYSPCPNDTFIFYALVHQKIDTRGLTFSVTLGDVEELNTLALSGELHITKISYHAFLQVLDTYILLDSGGALGHDCGPLLISKKALSRDDLEGALVAIPGRHTTANFLLDFFHSTELHKRETIFHNIEELVLQGEVDAGVIIHENRFTYADHGLALIQDLGKHWEETTEHPIPLGGIVAKKSIPTEVANTVNDLIKRSIEYAYCNEEETMEYVAQYAQEMSPEVMKKHIDLYVNEYSLSLGQKGRKAVETFYLEALKQGKTKNVNPGSLFLRPTN